jgi:hypothetical protein
VLGDVIGVSWLASRVFDPIFCSSLLPRAGRHRGLRVRVLRQHVRIPAVLAAVEIGERLAGERIHAAIVSQRDAGYAERKRRGC